MLLTFQSWILAAQADRLAELPAGQESVSGAKMNLAGGNVGRSSEGATHFSFMRLCKPGAENLLNEESPAMKLFADGPMQRDRVFIKIWFVRSVSS